MRRLGDAAEYLRDLGIGGTAVGTGVNVEPDYPGRMVAPPSRDDGTATPRGRPHPAHAVDGRHRVVQRRVAFARGRSLEDRDDLRLLASGPRTGLDEILLPAVQPGSSIMPGKVNPSIAEMVNQVCFQVMGNDAAVAMAGEHGQLELNVMMPVIAHNVLFSMRILTNAARALDERCVRGIEANEAQCAYWLERSAALATALAPRIGYAKAAAIAKESVTSGELIRDLAMREEILPTEELEKVLDLRRMTEIGVPGEEAEGRKPEAGTR